MARREEQVNCDLLRQVYGDAGSSIRPARRRGGSRQEQSLRLWATASQEWVLGFERDRVAGGQLICILSVVEAYTQECLALEVASGFPARRLTGVLEQVVAERGQPLAIRCDKRPNLTSGHFVAWCLERQIEVVRAQAAKPAHDSAAASFHGQLQYKCLAMNWFRDVFDARKKIAAWRIEYNEERPLGGLGYPALEELAAQAKESLPS
jgi:putative transposase